MRWSGIQDGVFCPRLSTLPRAGPTWAVFRIDEFAAEPVLEALGVLTLGKAEDMKTDTIAPEEMAQPAVRQFFFGDEVMVRAVVVPRANDNSKISRFRRVFRSFFAAHSCSMVKIISTKSRCDSSLHTEENVLFSAFTPKTRSSLAMSRFNALQIASSHRCSETWTQGGARRRWFGSVLRMSC